MTSSTGGGGRWPFERVGDEGTSGFGNATFGRGDDTPVSGATPGRHPGPVSAEHAASGGGRRGARGDGPPTSGGRRRPPLWLLIVIGLVVVGAIVAVILVLTNKSDTTETLPAVTVTLPVPTPTVDPIAREGGTAFQTALPSTVLAYALSEIVEYQPLLGVGAIEAWQLTYTDGAQNVVLYAGQFADAATADAAFEQVLAANPVDVAPATDAAQTPTPTPTDDAATATPTEPALTPAQGTVEVDGTQVGRYLFVPREDGTGSLWWTNTTVLLQLDGPATALQDIFAAFPL
jgi:hypothetical protein